MSRTERDRCPTCTHRVMFHSSDGCECAIRDGIVQLVMCPCTATREALLDD